MQTPTKPTSSVPLQPPLPTSPSPVTALPTSVVSPAKRKNTDMPANSHNSEAISHRDTDESRSKVRKTQTLDVHTPKKEGKSKGLEPKAELLFTTEAGEEEDEFTMDGELRKVTPGARVRPVTTSAPTGQAVVEDKKRRADKKSLLQKQSSQFRDSDKISQVNREITKKPTSRDVPKPRSGTPGSNSPPSSPRKTEEVEEEEDTSESTTSVSTNPKAQKSLNVSKPDTPSEFTLNEDGTYKSASLDVIIRELTNNTNKDTEFKTLVLLTFPTFTNSDALLDKILKKVDPNKSNDSEDQLFAGKLLFDWINYFSTDWNDELQQKLFNFVSEFPSESIAKKFFETSLLSNKKIKGGSEQGAPETLKSEARVAPKIIPFNLRKDNNYELDDFDAEEIARQLTLIDWKNWTKLSAREIICYVTSKNRAADAPNVTNFIDRFNDVAAWVATEIVMQSRLRDRVKVLQKFISIAMKCKEIGNFNTMMAIFSGLATISVHRLKVTWTQISKKAKADFDSLKELTSKDHNFRLFRQAMQKSPCTVPYMGLFLQDLLVTDEVLSNYDEHKLINLQKRRRWKQVTDQLWPIEKKPSSDQVIFESSPIIQNFLVSYIPRDDKWLYERSVTVEPKGATLNKLQTFALKPPTNPSTEISKKLEKRLAPPSSLAAPAKGDYSWEKKFSSDSPEDLALRKELHSLAYSEWNYANDLDILYKIGIESLPALLAADVMDEIFGNIEQIARFHTSLAKALENIFNNWKPSGDIGSLLTELQIPEKAYPLYTEYINSYDLAKLQKELTTNKSFSNYEENIAALLPSFSYSQYMQKPVNRLNYYSMQFRSILSKISVDTPNYSAISSLTKQIEKIATEVKIEKTAPRITERNARAQTIKQSLLGHGLNNNTFDVNGRKLEDETIAFLLNKKGAVKHQVVFWSDSVLFAKSTNANNWTFVGLLTLRFIEIKQVPTAKAEKYIQDLGIDKKDFEKFHIKVFIILTYRGSEQYLIGIEKEIELKKWLKFFRQGDVDASIASKAALTKDVYWTVPTKDIGINFKPHPRSFLVSGVVEGQNFFIFGGESESELNTSGEKKLYYSDFYLWDDESNQWYSVEVKTRTIDFDTRKQILEEELEGEEDNKKTHRLKVRRQKRHSESHIPRAGDSSVSKSSGPAKTDTSENSEILKSESDDYVNTPLNPVSRHTSVMIGIETFIFGGCNEQGCTNDLFVLFAHTPNIEERDQSKKVTLERYFPQNTGTPPSPRAGHTAVAYEKTLYIFGGENSSQEHLNDLYAFDTEKLRWTQIRTSNRVPPARAYHVAEVIGNTMLVFGGEGSDKKLLNDLWAYDFDVRKWTLIQTFGFMPTPRSCMASTARDDNLVVFGGKLSDGTIANDVYMFDPATGSWDLVVIPRGLQPRYGHSIIAREIDQSVRVFFHVFGGKKASHTFNYFDDTGIKIRDDNNIIKVKWFKEYIETAFPPKDASGSFGTLPLSVSETEVEYYYKKLFSFEMNVAPVEQNNAMQSHDIFNFEPNKNQHFSFLSDTAAVNQWTWDREVDFIRLSPTEDTSELVAETSIGRRVNMNIKKIPTDDKYRKTIEKMNNLLPPLVHPSLVSFFGIGEKDNHFWLASECFTGKSLREVLNNRKLFSKEKEGSFPGLDEDIIAYVAAQILNAVVFLHKNNISHGAIRSDNILVSKKGHLKLTRYWHRKYYRKLGIVGHYLSDVQGLNGEWIEKVPPIKVTETPVEPQTTTPPVEPAATPNNIEELSSMIDVSVVQEDHPAEKKPTKEEDPPSIIRRRRKTATRRSTRVGANDGDESPVKSPTKAQQEENQKPKEKVDEEKEPDDYWGSPQDKKNTWTLKSDIWALGVTLIELTGTCPPYILQLDNQYSDSMREFIVACTTEDLDSRPTAEALLSYKFITDAPKCSPSLVAGYLSVDKSSEDPSDENKPEEINFTKGNEERIRKFIQSQIERFNQTVVKDLNEENDKLKALVNTLSAQVSKLQTDVTELRKRKNKPTKT